MLPNNVLTTTSPNVLLIGCCCGRHYQMGFPSSAETKSFYGGSVRKVLFKTLCQLWFVHFYKSFEFVLVLQNYPMKPLLEVWH